MNVLVVTDSPEIWGAERSLADLAQYGPEVGINYTVLAPKGSPVHSYLAKRGVATVAVDLPKHPALARGGLRSARLRDLVAEVVVTYRAGLALARFARTFDGILSFSLWRNADVLVGARLARIKAWADLHETFTGRLGLLVNRAVLSAFDSVVAPSRWILDQCGLSGSRAHVVPRMIHKPEDGSDQVTRYEERRYTAGVFAQLQPHKGHALVIQAALIAAKSHPVRVLFVGSGGDSSTREILDAAIKQHPEIFELCSAQGQAVFDLMRQCRAVVNASDHEAFGRTMIEGAACGADPVAVGESGPAEIVATLGFGEVVDRSAEALSAALIHVASLDSERVADADRQIALSEHYGPDAVGKAYSEVFFAGRSA